MKEGAAVKVAVFYHFFPHYRAGVIKEISRRFDATFVGDADGQEGILPYRFDKERFRRVKTYYLGKFVFQPGSVRYCLFTHDAVLVFLASPNHITTWICALIGRARGKRVVFWGHGFMSPRPSIKNRIRKVFFSLAHSFYAYGWRAKLNAISFGTKPERVHVGFNSLDYDSQLPIRRGLCAQSTPASDHEALSIVCVSRLTHICRYDLLLSAMNILQKQGRQAKATFIGDGPARAGLEEAAARAGLDATFLGAIYDDKIIANLIYQADLTVSPGKVGLTAMHSLMFGTPVVTHDNFEAQMPEVEAVVPGKTGGFFLEGDAESLARTLEEMYTQLPSRAQTRENCFTMIDKVYNPRMQVKVLERAILGVPASRGDDAFTLFERAEK